jgi:hypothetical protein
MERLGSVEERVGRLSAASLRRLIDPDLDLPGELGTGQILPDGLLSINGLHAELSAEQRARLSREEVAAILDGGFRFEAALMSGFCAEIMLKDNLCDPRVAYALHEVGEETRHSRLFARVIEQTGASAKNPLRGGGRLGRWFERRSTFALIRRPALFNTMILSGEEIPDLIQKLASEHPDTDPFLAEVNRYHRREEARHLSFARLQVGERWDGATWSDRFAVRYLAPIIIRELFHSLVHPGVYETVGLPPWKTWFAVRRLPARADLLQAAIRPVLAALIDGGSIGSGAVPRGWRRICDVDRQGRPNRGGGRGSSPTGL